MTGAQVETAVGNWLARHFPGEQDWGDEGFHCFEGLPLELRMLPAHWAVEYNISNGGWAQLLWNCFGSWRRLIRIACDGYRLIGADQQAVALENARVLFERNEEECALFIRLAIAEDDFSYFGKFTGLSYGEKGNDWQDLFCDEALYARRLAWLEQNQAVIMRMLRSRGH